VDASPWTVVGTIAAILAVLVPIYHRWTDQHRRWAVTITITDPVRGSVPTFDVTIRNDGRPDLIILEPATVRIFDLALSKEPPVPLQFRRGPSGPPWRIQTEEELTSYTTITGLADALRMRGCMTRCRVRAEYRDRRDRAYRSDPFTVPVEEWLPADASARTLVLYRPDRS
jgi:hypothetical protein